ncbi:hypothetical protein F4677DRAFT_95231 [Hypoxylon crocopeplum]|nr:hypothetical protein F4677DRAFT_95231 [Hypoxylon crocopeplum]
MQDLSTASLPGPMLYGYVSSQNNLADLQKAEREMAQREIEAQKQRISELQAERAKLMLYLPRLHAQRARYAQKQKRQAADERKAKREARIRSHLANHLRDVQERVDNECLELSEAVAMTNRNTETIKRLEQEIGEHCLLVGKGNPQEVYDEVDNDQPPPPMLDGSSEWFRQPGKGNNGKGARPSSMDGLQLEMGARNSVQGHDGYIDEASSVYEYPAQPWDRIHEEGGSGGGPSSQQLSGYYNHRDPDTMSDNVLDSNVSAWEPPTEWLSDTHISGGSSQKQQDKGKGKAKATPRIPQSSSTGNLPDN